MLTHYTDQYRNLSVPNTLNLQSFCFRVVKEIVHACNKVSHHKEKENQLLFLHKCGALVFLSPSFCSYTHFRHGRKFLRCQNESQQCHAAIKTIAHLEILLVCSIPIFVNMRKLTCLKYAALWSKSTSSPISAFLGNGCMTTIWLLACFRTELSTMRLFLSLSYSSRSGKRSFWTRVQYNTSDWATISGVSSSDSRISWPEDTSSLRTSSGSDKALGATNWIRTS